MPYLDQKAFHEHDVPTAARWVFLGGTTLAFLAGYVNVLMLGVYHVPVSHTTGAVSEFSRYLLAMEWTVLAPLVTILLGFVIGAALSGLIIGRSLFREGRRYGSALVLQGGLLSLAALMAQPDSLLALALAAVACGLQNGMAASYRGLTLRTTHTTGLITDIGVFIGHLLRHRDIALWKLGLLVSLLGGFVTGGIVGALAYQYLGFTALWLAAAIHLALGAAYWWWQQD